MEYLDITITQLERLCKKFIINNENGCWEWQRAKTTAGYGTVEINHRQNSAHKWVYSIFTKTWTPKNMHLDHLCRNRGCVNPKHLELVTPRINLLRGSGQPARNFSKKYCKNGHEYTQENTYFRQRLGRYSERDCNTCRYNATKRYQLKKVRIVS